MPRRASQRQNWPTVVAAVAPAIHGQGRHVRQPDVLDVAVLPVAAKRGDARDEVRIMRREPDGREPAVRPARQEDAVGIDGEIAAERRGRLLHFDVRPFAALDLDVEAAPGVKAVGAVGHLDRRADSRRRRWPSFK